MLVLAVDTSTAVVSAALVEVASDVSTRVVARRDVAAPNRHGELLAQLIADLHTDSATSAADVDAVAAGVGPGPFTGLRVGVVTAAAIADALSVPAYAVCSLDAVAVAHADARRLLVCTDARRRQLYWARYLDGVRVEGPDLAAAQVLAERFHGQVDLVAGPGAALYDEVLAGVADRAGGTHPAAVSVAQVAAPRIAAGAPSERLDPMYLRRPDATPPGRPKRVTPA